MSGYDDALTKCAEMLARDPIAQAMIGAAVLHGRYPCKGAAHTQSPHRQLGAGTHRIACRVCQQTVDARVPPIFRDYPGQRSGIASFAAHMEAP